MVCINAQKDNSLAFKNIKVISNNCKKMQFKYILCKVCIPLYFL